MREKKGKVTAFVLIEVPAKHSGGITEAARGIPGVREAWALFGPYDVIAVVEASDIFELEKIIMENIQNLPQVKVTRTFIALSSI